MSKTIRFLQSGLAGFLLFLQMISAHSLNAAGRPNNMTDANLVLTVRNFSLESDREFSCSGGQLNGFLMLPAPASGAHVLESIWIKPSGEIQEHARIPLDFPAPGRQTAHIWLNFGQQDGILSSLQSHESSIPDFNGVWRVEVFWDNQPLVQKQFPVKC